MNTNKQSEADTIRQFTYLVKVVIAKKFFWLYSKYSREDLISFGMEGIWDAIRTFDPSLNIEFKYYVRGCISGSISKHIRKDLIYNQRNLSVKPHSDQEDLEENYREMFIDSSFVDNATNKFETVKIKNLLNTLPDGDYVKDVIFKDKSFQEIGIKKCMRGDAVRNKYEKCIRKLKNSPEIKALLN